jgi:hypothetical protein
MPLRRFLQFQLEQHLLRFRWVLPVLVMLFTTYVMFSGVFLQQLNHGLSVNLWDGLFTIFGSGKLLFYVLNVVWLYLISDLLPEKELGQLVLLRFGSRVQWWVGKVLALVCLALVYAGINFGIALGVAYFALPHSAAWSQAATTIPLEFYLVPHLVETTPPAWAFFHLALLFILGWIGLGVWGMVLAQWRQNAWAGFMGMMLINFGCVIALLADLSAPWVFLAPHYRFLLIYQFLEENASLFPALWFSWSYWLVWMGVGGYVGLKLSAHQDFYREEHEK